MARPAGLVRISDLAGAEIRYARTRRHRYGTPGKAHPNSVMPEMAEQLQKCFAELWRVCPYGPAEGVVSAGGWVDKPGMHGRGLALDVDAIWWKLDDFDRPQPMITNNAPHDAGRYLAVSAVLRMFFGTVIGYWCNRAHRDHFHVALRPVGFSPASKSEVAFVQAACLHVHGSNPGPVDRLCGPRTRAAVAQVVDIAGGDLRDRQGWDAFLRETFLAGWKCAENPWAE